MKLDTPLKAVYGIGPGLLFRLKNLGLETVWDLINHYPFRYDDFSNVTQALDAQVGERVTLKGEIWSINNIFTRTRKTMTRALFNDGTSTIELTWFNQPWIIKTLKVGDKLQISGKLDRYKNKLSIISPVHEKLYELAEKMGESHLHTGRLVPVYPETAGLNSKWIRAKIDKILPEIESQIEDPLPDDIRDEFVPLSKAIRQIHFPESIDQVKEARTRLAFDELFFLQLQNQIVRASWGEHEVVEPLRIENNDLETILSSLPFQLTESQLKVVGEVINDLKGMKPMNRLVQGEVGSGKTVVALILAYLVHKNKLRTLYMAPTEILAFQHYNNFRKFLEPLGLNIGLYTGSQKFTKVAEKKRKDSNVIPDLVGNPQENSPTQIPAFAGMTLSPDIIIGTHALLSDKLVTEEVGLIIIDEQQRFGVAQRSLLRSRAKLPHFLTMTATPIPRTVALTMYGDLDVSTIDQLPGGRKKIATHVIPAAKRNDSYEFIRSHIKEGDQCYLITPLIELSETLKSAKAAIEEFEKLKSKIFPDLRLGLLHGRLKPKEKDEVLNAFRDHQIDILVSTSVVEVGVDVPNATIMVIESAERFGLAQLHQLRGRVGRGEKQSFCFLFAGEENSNTVSRLRNLETIDNGLTLAELDLKMRGSGEIHGTAQSGRFELKIASFTDLPLIEKAREDAKKLVAEDPALEQHPLLKARINENVGYIMPD